MMDQVRKVVVPGQINNTVMAIPRDGTTDEISALLAYLLGDESKFTTGAEFKIDGGMVC